MAYRGAHAENPRLISGALQVVGALRTYVGDGVSTNLRALSQDPAFCAFLVTSVSCFGATGVVDLLRLLRRRKARNLALAAATPSSPKAKKKRPKKISADGEFFKHFVFLLRIVVPKLRSRGARLLLGHLLLLVMKTFLTVRCTKLTTYFLTRAIAAASWMYWIRWLVCFSGWTIAGTVINTGLKYMETQVALEFRRSLTRYIHDNYMYHNNFYHASSKKAAGLDNPDQRITADIAEFSKQAASLFGHSFTPILNFVMSLQEVSKDIGLGRPLVMFGWNVALNMLFAAITPSAAPMISREQALEGDFRAAHTRLIAHAEEVAFLEGGTTEHGILNLRLDSLVDTQSWHSLRKVAKDLADQFYKYQSMMTGGVFIHIPFLMTGALSDAERISAFRSTEVSVALGLWRRLMDLEMDVESTLQTQLSGNDWCLGMTEGESVRIQRRPASPLLPRPFYLQVVASSSWWVAVLNKASLPKVPAAPSPSSPGLGSTPLHLPQSPSHLPATALVEEVSPSCCGRLGDEPSWRRHLEIASPPSPHPCCRAIASPLHAGAHAALRHRLHRDSAHRAEVGRAGRVHAPYHVPV